MYENPSPASDILAAPVSINNTVGHKCRLVGQSLTHFVLHQLLLSH